MMALRAHTPGGPETCNRNSSPWIQTLTFLASAVTAAYLADWGGFRIVPLLILLVAAGAALAVYVSLSQARRAHLDADADDPAIDVDARTAAIVFAAVVAVSFASLPLLTRYTTLRDSGSSAIKRSLYSISLSCR